LEVLNRNGFFWPQFEGGIGDHHILIKLGGMRGRGGMDRQEVSYLIPSPYTIAEY
jgi:hypothetical protein